MRFERKHSLSLLHTDWYEGECGKNVIAFKDDTSRRVLAIGEFDEATDENTIMTLKKQSEKLLSTIR